MFFNFPLIITIFVNIISANSGGNDSLIYKVINKFGKLPQATVILKEISEKLPKSECVNKLALTGKALLTREDRALKMIDASAKIQSGLLLGNIMQIGNFDECIEMDNKYCAATFDFHPVYGKELERKFEELTGQKNIQDARKSYGICVPRECKSTELQIIANAIEDAFQIPLHFGFKENYCYPDGVPLTTSAMVSITIFAIFGAIIISSTLYDILWYSDGKNSLFTCFSVTSNWKKIFSQTSEEEIRCLNGIRVISMMWVVLGHRYIYAFYSPSVNAIQMIEWRNKLENVFLLAGTVSVDTFFTISGLLVVYSYMKATSKGVKIRFGRYYLHRIVRLTPSLAMLILFITTLLHHFGKGPFWFIVEESFQNVCRRHWWSTLLYVQNYVHPAPGENCVAQAWYLAVDTQMYFVSSIFLVPLAKWPRKTIFAIIGIVIAQSVYVFLMSLMNNFPASLFDLNEQSFIQLYMPTHVRGAVYFIGMLCGYYIFKTKSRPLKLQKWKVLGLWIASMMTLLGIAFSHMRFTTQYTTTEAALFHSLSRVGWAMGLSIVIVLCVNGYGGICDTFLSHDVFTVLIRLNYNVYLMHEVTMFFVVGQGRTAIYFSNLVMLHDFWGHYVFTLGLAIVWTLAFELPAVALEKYFLPKRVKS